MRHAAGVTRAEQAQKGAGQEKGPGREHERYDRGDKEQADERQALSLAMPKVSQAVA